MPAPWAIACDDPLSTKLDSRVSGSTIQNPAARPNFLMANFRIDCQGKITRYERCLACYPVESDHEERQKKITIANQRLKLLYEEFEQAAIRCEKRYF